MSKNHTGTSSEPYWLIREPGKPHGFGSLEFDGNPDPEAALNRFWEQMEPAMRKHLACVEGEAELVVLVYVNGTPTVCPVPV